MKLREIYNLFVKEGIKTELRTVKQLQKVLRDKRNVYYKSATKVKKFFDKESLNNPYADTRILFGAPNSNIRRVLVGIDIGVGELLLADRLSQSGKKIDLVIAHHPEGIALAGLDDVMNLQTDVINNLGIDFNVAKSLMAKRISKVSRGLHGENHTRSVDAAKLLNIPFICCHTPADNHVAKYLQNLVDKKRPKTLQHLIDLLLNELEYQDAALNKAGPQILIGQKTSKTGKVFVDMTGGTEGSEDIYARVSQLGINTLLGMHLSDRHFQKFKEEHINLVIAGHMASDNLGMNFLLDKVEKKGKLEIIECSGFRRIRRVRY